jgi:flagellar protein FlaG
MPDRATGWAFGHKEIQIMIIQNTNTNQGVPTAKLVSVEANVAAVASPAVTSNTASNAASPLNVVAQPDQVATRQPSFAQLKKAVDGINQAMLQSNQSLEFTVESGTNTPIVRIMDKETGQLIRQIPSEETLAISQSIDQFMQMQGLLLKQKA